MSRNNERKANRTAPDSLSVSYTHLDVYKRQALNCKTTSIIFSSFSWKACSFL